MHRIWKYTLDVTDEQTIDLPAGARLLAVQVQHGSPQLWALVNREAGSVRRTIRTYGTGHPIDTKGLGPHLGTYQLQDGALVFHVFEAF